VKKLLKNEGVLKEGDNLYAINIRMSPNIIGLNSTTQDYMKTRYVDSQGNHVDTSTCDKISIRMPNKDLNVDMKKYREMKKKGYDILDSNDNFFSDLCTSFESDDSKDVTLNKRREIFNIGVNCAEGCVFNGLDERGYSDCLCTSNISEISNEVKEKKYGFEIKSNIGIVKCHAKALEDINHNISFYVGLGVTCSFYNFNVCLYNPS
jgi:hypothetical protein